MSNVEVMENQHLRHSTFLVTSIFNVVPISSESTLSTNHHRLASAGLSPLPISFSSTQR